jgi:hypothetical protein
LGGGAIRPIKIREEPDAAGSVWGKVHSGGTPRRLVLTPAWSPAEKLVITPGVEPIGTSVESPLTPDLMKC